ncbi:hypothetical protein D0962_22770 [Leptolyngbyaceae cyanobacterium CCMR0082]|uniref:Uncharacterized protein n=1 Tax=Adonisia turfae CCMR0082 TaxID=2304604 RepID=A0A6M0SAL9_9CYAN|nr:hypothetical protein [Adonisia turfae]NEZ65545.1 hypothetical protein [Adonisia turfae CCMR0082]
MAISTLDTDTRNAALQAANTELNDGAGSNATYEYLVAGGGTVLIAWDLDGAAPFTTAGSTTAGTAELTGEPITATAVATGTAAEYRIKDKDGAIRRSGVLDATLAVTSGSVYNLSATAAMPAS